MLEVMSTEDEDDIFSPDEEGKHNVLNLFPEVVGQSSPGMQVVSFLEDEEPAREENEREKKRDWARETEKEREIWSSPPFGLPSHPSGLQQWGGSAVS